MRTQRHREAESCRVGEVRDTHEAAAREHHIRAVGIIIKAGSIPTFFPRAPKPRPQRKPRVGGPVSRKWQWKLDTKLVGVGSLELWRRLSQVDPRTLSADP